MIPVITVSQPEQELEQRIENLRQLHQVSDCFALQYDYCQYYLPESPSISLLAIIAIELIDDSLALKVAVAEFCPELQQRLQAVEPSVDACAMLASELGLAWVDLHKPLTLDPIAIPKPWGQEIWYTGIEARGQSNVVAGGHHCPLPWLLSVAPLRLVAGMERQLTLLKILDPLPEEVYGDLYFEMHEEKQEVYVVTHVDEAAWPNGVGGIRFGFDPQVRARYSDNEQFKSAYLQAVKAYESVRRAIDRQLDEKRQSLGIDLSEPVDAITLQAWHHDLAPDLLRDEVEKRSAMDAFTAMKPLRLGDVVKVPCYTPHSLQHGVRTVEFQTPVYERKILAFGQKVLTQSHWDTDTAIDIIEVETPAQPELKVLRTSEELQVEVVVEFDDFAVHRYTMGAGAKVKLPEVQAFSLLMVVSGQLLLANQSVAPEKACLLPAGLLQTTVINSQSQPVVFLLAVPNLVL